MASPNPHQLRCIETEGHLQINACPGSGKTFVLSHRAKSLLSKYDSGNLLAVTYTKDAAGELKERVTKELPAASARVHAGTFHSLAGTQLRRAGVIPDLMSKQEIKAVLNNILDSLTEPPELKAVEGMFSAIQSAINPDDHPILVGSSEMRYIWGKYQQIKMDAGKMDFSDLLVNAVRGMSEGWVQPYNARWILGDEAQDMDEVQHAWIKLHAENGSDITLVSDDDQSIFAFRAASGYEGIRKFQQELDATALVLPINYRCGRKILSAAAKLIEHNSPNRIDKPIEAGVDYEGVIHDPIGVHPCEDQGAHRNIHEFRSIIEEIVAQDFRNKKTPGYSGDWAILARGGLALNELEFLLMEQGIDYARKTGSFWDQPIIANYLSILKYLTSREWFGFAIYINGYLGTDKVFDPSCKSLKQLYKMVDSDEIRNKVRTLLYYEQEWKKLISEGSDESIRECLHDVVEFMDHNSLSRSVKTKDSQRNKLVAATMILVKMSGLSLRKRVSIASQPAKDKNAGNDKKRAAAIEEGRLFVSLMTMHSSKGLEFDNVWLASCESETFTAPRPDGTMANVPEERRLFYVAVTRARHNLHSSYVSEGGVKNALFLQEAGILDWAE